MKLVKINVSMFLSLLLICPSLSIAQEEDNKPKLERGFRFGDVQKTSKDENLKGKSQKELLAELVKLSRKQLKEQKRIREILENEYDQT